MIQKTLPVAPLPLPLRDGRGGERAYGKCFLNRVVNQTKIHGVSIDRASFSQKTCKELRAKGKKVEIAHMNQANRVVRQQQLTISCWKTMSKTLKCMLNSC